MSHTPPVDSKGAAIRDEILEIAIRWRKAVEKVEAIEGKLPSRYLEDAILAILAQEVNDRLIQELTLLDEAIKLGATHRSTISQMIARIKAETPPHERLG